MLDSTARLVFLAHVRCHCRDLVGHLRRELYLLVLAGWFSILRRVLKVIVHLCIFECIETSFVQVLMGWIVSNLVNHLDGICEFIFLELSIFCSFCLLWTVLIWSSSSIQIRWKVLLLQILYLSLWMQKLILLEIFGLFLHIFVFELIILLPYRLWDDLHWIDLIDTQWIGLRMMHVHRGLTYASNIIAISFDAFYRFLRPSVAAAFSRPNCTCRGCFI